MRICVFVFSNTKISKLVVLVAQKTRNLKLRYADTFLCYDLESHNVNVLFPQVQHINHAGTFCKGYRTTRALCSSNYALESWDNIYTHIYNVYIFLHVLSLRKNVNFVFWSVTLLELAQFKKFDMIWNPRIPEKPIDIPDLPIDKLSKTLNFTNNRQL